MDRCCERYRALRDVLTGASALAEKLEGRFDVRARDGRGARVCRELTEFRDGECYAAMRRVLDACDRAAAMAMGRRIAAEVEAVRDTVSRWMTEIWRDDAMAPGDVAYPDQYADGLCEPLDELRRSLLALEDRPEVAAWLAAECEARCRGDYGEPADGEPASPAPTAEAGPAPKSPRRRGITRDEANVRAREYLRQHARGRRVNKRELAAAIGCSDGLIPRLPVWQAYQQELRAAEPAEPRAVALTATTENQAALRRLIAAQEADSRADNSRRGRRPRV